MQLPIIFPPDNEPPRWIQTSLKHWALPDSSRNKTKFCPSIFLRMGWSVRFSLCSATYQKLINIFMSPWFLSFSNYVDVSNF